MTYLGLLVLGLVLPGVLLSAAAPPAPRAGRLAVAGLAALALAWTVPWDAALLRAGTWRYPHGQLLPWVAGVPLEEWAFVVLQTAVVGLWLQAAHGRTGARASAWRGRGTGGWLLVAVVGALLLGSPRSTYLGALLAWTGPVLALQSAVGGDRLRGTAPLVAVPTLWLCGLDRLALHLHLWQLSSARTTGATVLGLPLEEALFFLLTDLLVVRGLLLAADAVVLSRVRSLRSVHLGAEVAGQQDRGRHVDPHARPVDA